MILTILFIILCIVSLIVFLLAYNTTIFGDADEGLCIANAVLGFIGAVGFLVCGGVSIANNTKICKQKMEIKLQERIESINNTKEALTQKIESSTYTILEINDYNKTVRDFKTELKTAQLELKNPWINWFTCPVYNNFDADCVSYLYVK